MSKNANTQAAPRSGKGAAALLAGLVGAGLAATLAGPAPSASAMITDRNQGTGNVYFADASWNPTPALRATEGARIELSTGGLIVTPDTTAKAGVQTAKVTYELLKRNDRTKGYDVVRTRENTVPLQYHGANVSQSIAGSGTLAEARRGSFESYEIRVRVSWWVDGKFQSQVQLTPDKASELSCGTVNHCSIYAPGNGPARLGFV